MDIFILLLFLIGFGSNLLCPLFIITPLAKDFPQRKVSFLASVIPIIVQVVSFRMFFAEEEFRQYIQLIALFNFMLFCFILFAFIKNKARLKHDLYLLALLISIIWGNVVSWAFTETCAFGVCF